MTLPFVIPHSSFGVIPAQDYDFLYQNGAAAIFGPGTVIPDSARKILKLLLEQLG